MSSDLPPFTVPDAILSEWLKRILARADGMGKWLHSDPERECCFRDQLHTTEGTSERTYWHMGYRCGIGDAIRLLERMVAEAAQCN